MNDALNDMPKADTHGKITSRDYENIKVPRIGLEWRIKEETGKKPDFLKVFELFTDDYFIGLSRISGSFHFADRYKNFISRKEGGTPHLLSVCMHYLASLSEEDRALFLYYTLIEPFAKIPELERSKDE